MLAFHLSSRFLSGSSVSRAVLPALVFSLGVVLAPDPSRAAQADTPHVSEARGHLRLSPLGQVGGTTLAMDADGRYVYFGVGPRLVVADAGEPQAPQSPRKVGESEPLGDLVRDVVVTGQRAYVAAGSAGLAELDIADPTHPTVLAALDTPGHAWSVAHRGRIYVADGPGGLRVTTLTAGVLREVASLELAADALRVAATDSHVYVVVDVPEDYDAGFVHGLLQIVDVNQPTHPRLVEENASDLSGVSVVEVEGEQLFAAGRWEDEALKVFDLSEPAHPEPLGSLALEYRVGPVNDMAVDGTHVALAQGLGHPIEGWVTVVDISDPALPRRRYSVNVSPRGLQAVAVFGEQLAVALPEGGIVTFDTTDPERPVAREALQVGFEASSAAVSGETVYVAASTAGLGVVDVHAPHAPVLRGLHRGQSGGAITEYRHVALRPSSGSSSRYAYLTSRHGDVVSTALRVFDVADGDSAREVAALHEPWTWFGALAVTQDHAFVVGDAFSLRELRVFDVSTALTPTLAATMTLQGPRDIALRDGYAYVADDGYGLRVVDVRDPTAPRPSGGPGSVGSPVSLSATDQLLLLAGSLSREKHGAFSVFDRSDPASPRLEATAMFPEWPTSVAAGDRWACVGFRGGGEWPTVWETEPAGIYLIDLQDPAGPTLVQRLELAGTPSHVLVDDGNVYVSMGGGGLHIVEVAEFCRQIYLPSVMAPAR